VRAILAAIAVVAVSAPAHAEWGMTADLEHFRWSELNGPGVTERGPRVGIGIRYSRELTGGWLFGYRGRAYFGTVDYEGAFLDTGAPASGLTEYSGIVNELQALYRLPDDPSGLALVGGLILDYWNRQLSANQSEEYWIASLRLGLQAGEGDSTGWFGGGGVKYPFFTREDAHLTSIGFDSNPGLEPKGALSFYAELGYRFNRSLSLEAYYDSYRFDESDPTPSITNPSISGCAPPGGCQLFQPASDADIFGLRLVYTFR
jgi:hypothetical protein